MPVVVLLLVKDTSARPGEFQIKGEFLFPLFYDELKGMLLADLFSDIYITMT